jgi:hypothetical protein
MRSSNTSSEVNSFTYSKELWLSYIEFNLIMFFEVLNKNEIENNKELEKSNDLNIW